jgi:hypothetical protein
VEIVRGRAARLLGLGDLGISRISIVTLSLETPCLRQEEAKRIRRDEGDLRVALALLYPNSNWNAVIYFAGLFAGLTSMASASVRRTTISSPFLTSFNRFTLSSTFKVTVFCCGPRKVTVRVL